MKNIKRLSLLFVLFFSATLMSGCNRGNQLLILNWGEYINDDMVKAFEEETGYEVIISIADSNELFYSKVKSGTTAYDLVVPSDYMVEKMVQKNLLQKIDYSKLTNYDLENNPYMPGVTGIQSEMFEGNEDFAVPYFWGTFGIMYNKQKAGLEEAILTEGWEAYFNPEKRPQGTRVGMYNTPRFAYAAALFSENLSPNLFDETSISLVEEKLSRFEFNEWGFDTLKKGIVANNLDMAYLYTGDFLDMLYTRLDAGDTLEDITFDIYIPDQTIAFMDFFVIPKNARHVDMAHEFIDFFLRPEVAYENASVVGYATPLRKAYDLIVSHIDDEDPWLSAWAYANKTYYPLPKEGDTKLYKGTPLSNFTQAQNDRINLLINNIKSK